MDVPTGLLGNNLVAHWTFTGLTTEYDYQLCPFAPGIQHLALNMLFKAYFILPSERVCHSFDFDMSPDRHFDQFG